MMYISLLITLHLRNKYISNRLRYFFLILGSLFIVPQKEEIVAAVTIDSAKNLVRGGDALISLFSDRKLDATATGQGHVGLATFANDENVAQSSSKS
jgi:hypothetical protein